MTPSNTSSFRLIVLNPGGRDPAQSFREPATGASPPVNVFAYAACTSGAFHRDTKQAAAEDAPVLVLLRGNFKDSERAVDRLKEQKRKVAVCFKEAGLNQIAQQLNDRAKLTRFLRILSKADGCLAIRRKRPRFINMRESSAIRPQSLSFRLRILWKIANGISRCRPINSPEFSSGHANGMLLHAITPPRCWPRERFAM